MFTRSQQNKVSYSDDSSDPNYVYYDATIISNDFDDVDNNGVVTSDPQITFNDQRTFPLIKDASLYEMSIIRFTLNGPGLDLPLFIPNIQLNQSNINLTEYSVTLTYSQQWNVSLTAGGTVLKSFNIVPLPSYVIYSPENKNPILAPTPRAPIPAPGTSTGVQDISSKYYWITTYDYWLSLVNNTFVTAAQNVFTAFQTEWYATPGVLAGSFPYANLTAFETACSIPYMTYDENTLLFTIYEDSAGYGPRLLSFTPASPGAQTAPQFRIFFNTNMNGLFSNFTTRYWNVVNIPSSVYNGVTYGALTVPNVGGIYDGYVYEVMVTNKFFQNVNDYRNAPFAGNPPAGYVPIALQSVYWVNTQNYKSIDSLWSPIGSIVFTSSLLPIKTEDTSQPNILGSSNTGISNPSGFSAFTPIITDIVIDTSEKGAHSWREFTEYIPQAEYRMTSFGSSHQPISNIDISVFWKNRLNNQLYPIYLYNLATVSIKIMFRKKPAYMNLL